jgi:outer membrane autotransporter protein
LSPGAGQIQTISDAIVDQTGAGGTGTNAGSWSLVKNGTGTTILSGANAYTGGTTVSGGVLQGNSTSLQGSIVNNATVVFDQASSGTYAGNMSGTGTLTMTGAGTLTLSGTNTYGGGTTVNGGTLLFTSDANLGAAGVGISLNNGTIGVASGGGGQVINRPLTITSLGAIYVSQNVTNPVTWSGAIGGAGMLVVDGGGTVNLSGTNTYAGGTKVTSSTLLFTSDANLGAAATGITLNGGTIGTTKDAAAALSINRSLTLSGGSGISVYNNPLVWSGDISGSGQLMKIGAGVLQLTGTNTYGGGTVVAEGTLQVASDDKLGAAGTGVTLINNGSLWATGSFTTARPFTLANPGGGFQVEAGTILTLTGSVSGGTLGLVGTGILVLAGTSSYSGINNYGGTVQGDTATLRGNIFFDTNAGNPNARSVTFDQATDGTFAGTITGIGSLTKTGPGKLILSGDNTYSTGTTVSAGVLQGTSRSLQGAIVNNAAVIFDQAFDGTYAGNMTGTGTLTKNGTGKLNLTGTSSVGGGTTINDGGFAVNGHLTSNVTVNKGGTLSGSGNVTGNITNNGGTIKPGNSIGHLKVDGNFTNNSGTLEIEVNAQGDSDRISVVGAGHKVMINAGTLQILPQAGTYVPNTTYAIITTEGGGTVAFGNVTGGVGFLTPQVSLDSQHIYVSLVLPANAFRSGGQTVNQQAVGGALDAMAASGNVGGVVTTMANLSPAQGAAALQALSPEAYADFGTVNIRSSQLFANAVGRQMAVERGGAIGSKSVALAEACDVACDDTAPLGLSAWLSGIGSTGSVLGNGNAAGLTYTLGGTAFGIDWRLDPRFLVGIAGGWVGGSQWVNGFGGNGYTDSLSVALYGSFRQGGFYVDALAGYANSNNRLQRVISIPGQAAAVANGQTSANQFLGQLETGYKIGLPFPADISISPFGRLQIGSANQAAFSESGTSPFNLSVAQQATTSVRTTFGADLGASFDLGEGRPLEVGLRLGWMHEFADTARPITAAFAAAPVQQFTVWGATPQRDSAVIGFSASAAVTDRASLFASYDGEVGGGTDNHALRVGFRLTW